MQSTTANNIIHIKEVYNKSEVQNDIHHDSITIFASNISCNFMKYNKRKMDNYEVLKLVNIFRHKLEIYNDLDIEYNQTS